MCGFGGHSSLWLTNPSTKVFSDASCAAIAAAESASSRKIPNIDCDKMLSRAGMVPARRLFENVYQKDATPWLTSQGRRSNDYKKKTARSQRALVPPSPLSARGRERFLFIVGPDAICPHVR